MRLGNRRVGDADGVRRHALDEAGTLKDVAEVLGQDFGSGGQGGEAGRSDKIIRILGNEIDSFELGSDS